MRQQLGLDRPWLEQYGLFLKRLVVGDEHGWPGFGISFQSREPVLDGLAERLPQTLALALGAGVLWLVLGVGIGVAAAVRRRTLVDRAALGFSLLGVSAPVFLVGLLSLFLFWKTLGWLPGTGYVPFSESPREWFLHLVQPWLVLALLFAASYARMTRASLLDALGEDFVRTARAKGLSERRVVWRHGLRAGLALIVTMLGMDLALLVGGAVVTEKVFNLQGVSSWAVDAALGQDLPPVVAVTLVGAAAIVVASLIVDLAYAWLDPRVRLA
ncbi:MAG: ABC transporter permease [Thermoleophilia bacterium]